MAWLGDNKASLFNINIIKGITYKNDLNKCIQICAYALCWISSSFNSANHLKIHLIQYKQFVFMLT